jgi:hypothetical protein
MQGRFVKKWRLDPDRDHGGDCSPGVYQLTPLGHEVANAVKRGLPKVESAPVVDLYQGIRGTFNLRTRNVVTTRAKRHR